MNRNLLVACVVSIAITKAAAQEACAPYKDVGCLYAPAGAAGSGKLLVYFRGDLTEDVVYEDGGRRLVVPRGTKDPRREARTASARAAFSTYRLADAADALGTALLVVGSGKAEFGAAELAELNAANENRYKELSVAAHSGGVSGFSRSLRTLPKLRRVALLDCFFEDGQKRYLFSAARELRRRKSEDGTGCGGYHTALTRVSYPSFVADAGKDTCAIDEGPAPRGYDPNEHYSGAAVSRHLKEALLR